MSEQLPQRPDHWLGRSAAARRRTEEESSQVAGAAELSLDLSQIGASVETGLGVASGAKPAANQVLDTRQLDRFGDLGGVVRTFGVGHAILPGGSAS